MVAMVTFEDHAAVNSLVIEECKAEEFTSDKLKDLLGFMKEGGYGCLAGPQLGLNNRFFLMEGKAYINPYIEEISEKGKNVFEVCDNFPEKRLESKRYQWVEISYQENGQSKTEKFEGDKSQYVQFCMDWLEGSLGNVVQTITQKTVKNEGEIGRNDPCKCGSGKKFKKCCAKI